MSGSNEAWRQLLDDELSQQPAPPLDGLVAGALLQGRRMRRTRAIRNAVVSCAAVLLVAVSSWAVTTRVAGRPAPGTPAASATVTAPPAGSPSAGSPPAGSPSAEPSTAEPSTAGASATRPATPAALVALLRQLLPAGARLSNLVSDGSPAAPAVTLYVDDGHGPGMLRIGVRAGGQPGGPCEQPTCRPLPGGGSVTVVRQLDNCVQALLVTADRGTGTVVDLQLSSCLAWQGTSNPAGRLVLDEDRAVAVASDQRWGLRMPQDLVDAGSRDYPQLTSRQGP